MKTIWDRRTLLVSSLGVLTPACSAPGAGDEQALRGLVRHRILDQHAALAAVVASLRNSHRSIISVRDPGAGEAYALGANTIFEIASLTKVFTALLLAVEVVHGRVRLDDPLQAYVPEGVVAPTFEGRQISLTDLATHGAALPLRPNNLAATAPDAPNKYAGYTREQLYAALPTYRLTRAPGTEFEYSNLAFALLGQGIALREGAPYADLLRTRVIEPLGLRDTSFEDDPAKARRRAQGHDFDLEPIGPMGDGALAPAGELRSTANDLLILLKLFLNQRGPRDLVAAARLMLSVDRPGDDDATRMALGWRRTTIHGETYYWSNGSGDGSRTFMGFNPARNSAVVALADAANGRGLDDIARHCLDPAQEVDAVVVPAPDFVTLPEDVLSRALGRYEYAADDWFEISRGATGLIATMGPSQLVIRPVSPTRYESRMAPGLAFEFVGADAGPASGLILHQDGQDYLYRRVE
jgi:CubicO group peptidase (beta-lactamase class C family)